MSGLTTNTVVQTTWKLPFFVNGTKVLTVNFVTTQGDPVTFTLDGESGLLSDIKGFTLGCTIPNWYSSTPFLEWSIHIGDQSIFLYGSTLLRSNWTLTEPTLQHFLTVVSGSEISAIWSGKYGYRILPSET